MHVYLKGFYVFSCLLPENMQCPIQGNLDMRKQLHFFGKQLTLYNLDKPLVVKINYNSLHFSFHLINWCLYLYL